MGETGADIKLSPTAFELIPFSIECKNKETGFSAVYQAFEQAQANSNKDIEPVVFIKQNSKKPLVVLDAEQFFCACKLIKGRKVNA
jgi:hypothetical protein